MGYQTGLLILTSPLKTISERISNILNVARGVKKTLYIYVEPLLHKVPAKDLVEFHQQSNIKPDHVCRLGALIYKESSKLIPSVDVRMLIPTKRLMQFNPLVHNLSEKYDVVFTDYPERQSNGFNTFVRSTFPNIQDSCTYSTVSVPDAQTCTITDQWNHRDMQCYDNVVLGGTFDRLHNGHKILLHEACLICTKSLTIGVTDGPMIKKKVLSELILPLDERMETLRTFLEDVNPTIEYDLQAIIDPFGPAIVDTALQCIIVSQETARGGSMVNEKRKEKGMSVLDVHTIEIMEDIHHTAEEETKISSSSLRKRLLGTLLRPPKLKPSPNKLPYILGVTGSIASGKSSVCRRLEEVGAAVINCDKLGHKAYTKGSVAHEQIQKTFDNVLNDAGEIDRKKLGGIVFSSQKELDKLNEIVWPAIEKLISEEIEFHKKNGTQLVVLDAAVLIQANWDKMAHETWACIIPKADAIKRVMERDNLPESEAERRMDSQLSCKELVRNSNVVLCTLWDYSITKDQVYKAWELLKERIGI